MLHKLQKQTHTKSFSTALNQNTSMQILRDWTKLNEFVFYTRTHIWQWGMKTCLNWIKLFLGPFVDICSCFNQHTFHFDKFFRNQHIVLLKFLFEEMLRKSITFCSVWSEGTVIPYLCGWKLSYLSIKLLIFSLFHNISFVLGPLEYYNCLF